MEAVLLLFAFLAIILIFLIKNFNHKNGSALVISGALFGVLLYYCVVPIIGLYCHIFERMKLVDYLGSLTKATSYDYFRLVTCISVFLIVTLSVYSHVSKKYKRSYIDEVKFKNNVRFWTWFTFIVGGLCFLLYAYSIGGFVQLLLYAETLRSHATDKTQLFSGRSFILVIPSKLITVSPYLILLYIKCVKKSRFLYLLFAVSLLLTTLFYLADAGKAGLLVFGLSFLVPLLSYKFKHKWLVTIFLGVTFVGVANYLDALFLYMATGNFDIEASGTILDTLYPFSYPLSNVLNLDGIINVSGIRYCQDFITGVLNIIPGINFQESIVPTSIFYGGYDWKAGGGVPNDVLTFGYLELGILGVAIVGTILGYITAIIDRGLLTLGDSFAERIVKCTLIICIFLLMSSADVVGIVRGQFLLTILSVLIITSQRK